MKNKYEVSINVPEEIECSYSEGILECKSGDKSFSKQIKLLGTELKIHEGKIIFSCKKANKKNIKSIMSLFSHVKNGFDGLKDGFVYKLEICHVHFPMNVKIEGSSLVISNFLGEKRARTAKLLQGVNVEVKGKDIIVSSHNIEKAGQTASNIEKATKVRAKDRRIFQDGIFITQKPKGAV